MLYSHQCRGQSRSATLPPKRHVLFMHRELFLWPPRTTLLPTTTTTTTTTTTFTTITTLTTLTSAGPKYLIRQSLLALWLGASHMTDTFSNTRVQQIIMNYQQFAAAPPSPSFPHATPSPTVSHVIHRKPPANYSPMPKTPTSTHRFGHLTTDRTPSLSSSTAVAPSSPYSPTTPSSTWSARPTSTPSLAGFLSPAEVDAVFRTCLTLLKDAVTDHGKRPFSALLLAADNSTVLLTHNSISHVQHAESELARLASLQYSSQFLAKCTLVSTWEPCAMCAGTIYWAGIGRVVYAASEHKLRELTGPGNEENMTMDLPCRTVFNAGQRKVDVIGPIPPWEEKVVSASKAWWDNHATAARQPSSLAADTTGKPNGGPAVVVVSPDSMLGSVGEDGEYQADLKVDWMM